MAPMLPLRFSKADKTIWLQFAEYHYLNHKPHPACEWFLAWTGPHPVGVVAMLHAMGFPGYYRVSRLVVLPNFQGHGIGGRFLDWIAAYYTADRKARRVSVVTALLPIICHCESSDRWQRTRRLRHGNVPQHRHTNRRWDHVTSAGRAVIAYRYLPPSPSLSPLH